MMLRNNNFKLQTNPTLAGLQRHLYTAAAVMDTHSQQIGIICIREQMEQ